MKKLASIIFLFFYAAGTVKSQSPAPSLPTTEMLFISDTQQPMWVETLLHKQNQNLKATADIFSEILQRKPRSLYMLGDVVALGYSSKKWRKVDRFLDSCRKLGTGVWGILGNHEIMGRKERGESNFNKRFPGSVRTGYVSVTDSVAVVLFKSNFKYLSAASVKNQQEWDDWMVVQLDSTDSIKVV